MVHQREKGPERATELREEARMLLGKMSQADNLEVKRSLAKHAFELLREAEELCALLRGAEKHRVMH